MYTKWSGKARQDPVYNIIIIVTATVFLIGL